MSELNKIVFVISNISIGGAQRIALTITQWLQEKGYIAKIVAISHSHTNYVIRSGIDVEILNHKSSRNILRTIKLLRKYLKKEKPEIVITMGISTCLFSVPAIMGIKVIKHIISERNDPRHFLGKKSTIKISRLLMKTGDGFVFQTEEARDFYSKSIGKRSKVIPNPILTKNLPNALGEHKLKEIVTMGRLTEQKNQKLLIDAFDQFWKNNNSYELHIFGSGKLKTDMIAYSHTKESGAHIYIHESRNDVLERIKKSEIFVLSSDFEGMPNALMEAMSIGLPCISTDCPCGGPRYLIENFENGILVPINDCNKMVEAITYLVNNPDERNRIAKNATMLKEALSADKICKIWLDYCKNVLSGK